MLPLDGRLMNKRRGGSSSLEATLLALLRDPMPS